MILSVNFGDTNKVNFGNNTVDVLKLNGVSIWESLSNDVVFHINMTQQIIDDGFGEVQLAFSKNDTIPNTINWGDGSDIVTTTTTNENKLTHIYTSPIETDVVIGGDGTLKVVGSSQGALVGIGSGFGTSQFSLVQYYKLGKICEGIQNVQYADTTGINWNPNVSYERQTTIEPFGFNGGINLSQCYYNPNMTNFAGTLPITQPLYQNETGANDYLVAFEIGTKKIASIGTNFDKATLSNYDLNGIKLGGVTNLSENVYPESIIYFYHNCLSFTTSGVVLRFNTPAGVTVYMPQAGDGTGVSYYKNARTATIYTDNETIKNYDWATDNVTATIYHLDGTLWG